MSQASAICFSNLCNLFVNVLFEKKSKRIYLLNLEGGEITIHKKDNNTYNSGKVINYRFNYKFDTYCYLLGIDFQLSCRFKNY